MAELLEFIDTDTGFCLALLFIGIILMIVQVIVLNRN